MEALDMNDGPSEADFGNTPASNGQDCGNAQATEYPSVPPRPGYPSVPPRPLSCTTDTSVSSPMVRETQTEEYEVPRSEVKKETSNVKETAYDGSSGSDDDDVHNYEEPPDDILPVDGLYEAPLESPGRKETPNIQPPPVKHFRTEALCRVPQRAELGPYVGNDCLLCAYCLSMVSFLLFCLFSLWCSMFVADFLRPCLSKKFF